MSDGCTHFKLRVQPPPPLVCGAELQLVGKLVGEAILEGTTLHCGLHRLGHCLAVFRPFLQSFAVTRVLTHAKGKDYVQPDSAHFRGETFGASGFPPPKVPLAPGNCISPFSAQPGDFSKCQGPPQAKNGPKYAYFAFSRPWESGRADFLPLGVRRPKPKTQVSCGNPSRTAW